jgi:hypothetical protein
MEDPPLEVRLHLEPTRALCSESGLTRRQLWELAEVCLPVSNRQRDGVAHYRPKRLAARGAGKPTCKPVQLQSYSEDEHPYENVETSRPSRPEDAIRLRRPASS